MKKIMKWLSELCQSYLVLGTFVVLWPVLSVLADVSEETTYGQFCTMMETVRKQMFSGIDTLELMVIFAVVCAVSGTVNWFMRNRWAAFQKWRKNRNTST